MLFICFVILTGATLPIQAAVNVRLRQLTSSSYSAAMVSFLVGTMILVLLTFSSGQIKMADLRPVTSYPWWIWIGGFIGVVMILTTTYCLPKLGSALTFSLTLIGQMLMAIIIDHFGLLHMPIHEASLPKILGIALIIAGIFCIQYKKSSVSTQKAPG
ncbi:DMT family transporter [Brevibacillus sp. NRS-1366]|uniref:DMT family transporter n=1 Tax=Brevibacillus sp. NRS-1366 TaxID=3233899 RepID=UPI003D221799